VRRKVTDSTAGSVGRIIGGVIALIFGVIWTVTATAMGAPTFFGLFGVLFCCAAIGGILLGLYNASAAPKDRIGAIEIVDLEDSVHCKHCGKSISDDSKFCRHCGGKQ
jgi:zinc-ribbon domain